MAWGYTDAAHHREEAASHSEAVEAGQQAGDEGKKLSIDVKGIIFEHLGDCYGWEVPFSHSKRIPLPIIVKGQDGWHVFSSSRVTGGETFEGFKIAEEGDNHGKVVEVLADGTEVRPLDFSVTKNACGIFISAIVVLMIVFSLKRWYARNGMKAPRGFKGAVELVVDFVYGDTIKPIMGKDAPKYGPYLLTVFFFILTMNLLGLIVIFPGGANLTGNIAVTMVLAVMTFLITNFTGTKHYWLEVLWPDVPMALKCPVPLMPLIEVLGLFTKPIALMIRLFANMMSGHMVVIVFVMLIFIFTELFNVFAGAGTSVLSLVLSLFMLVLDTLVSFIQAYVFTILSTMFIHMAHVHEEH